MQNMITKTFKILGIMMLSMVLWGFIFGAGGRTFMWKAIEPAIQRQWSNCTLNDGKVMSDVISGVFDSAPEYSH